MNKNFIYEYYQKITDGSIVVGKWILLFYKIIISGIEEGRFFYSQKKANRAIKFIENFCHHCEGQSGYLKLELWQKAFVSVVFGILDAEGNRQFREVILIMARKMVSHYLQPQYLNTAYSVTGNMVLRFSAWLRSWTRRILFIIRFGNPLRRNRN